MNVGQACELNNWLSDRSVLFSLTFKFSFFHIPLLSLIKSLLGGWWSGDHGVEPVFQVLLRHLLPARSRLGRCDVFVFRFLHLLFYHLLHVLTPWRLKEHMVTLTIIYVLTCLIIWCLKSLMFEFKENFFSRFLRILVHLKQKFDILEKVLIHILAES